MTGLLVPAHMGSLHAYEHILVWLLAFGPFVVLFFVVHRVRRRDIAQEQKSAAQEAGSEPKTDAQPVSPSDRRAS